MPKKNLTEIDVTAGVPGKYKLNQHIAIFNDRRTKRNRNRRNQRINAIKESLNNEKRN
jgi:hypothetical protein